MAHAAREREHGRYRRGVGIAAGYWPYSAQPGCQVELAVRDGRLVASTSTQDICNGARTVLANTVVGVFALERNLMRSKRWLATLHSHQARGRAAAAPLQH